jgi:enoyl-CoA hydratase
MGNCTKFEVVDNIGILTFTRPPVNAVNQEIRLTLTELFESVTKSRTDIYAIVLCSDQKGFCGGADTKEWYTEAGKNSAAEINRMQDAIFKCNVPVIAAVNGFCVGMGFGIASLCDVIVAEKDAWFQFPEVNVGTVGGPAWLTRIMPEKMSRYYLLTGERIPAAEMYRLGIVYKLVEKEELFDTAMTIARKLTAKYPPTLWAIKTMMNLTEREAQDVIDVTGRMRALGNREVLGDDPNKREMTKAFNEHRQPVYDMQYLERAQERLKQYK